MKSQDLSDLIERAKELECVYDVDRVLQNHELTLPEMIKQLTTIIPPGFSEPGAARVRITLWNDVYETPGFEGADVIFTAPIMIENQPIGEISAAYRTDLLKKECPLLQYEAKLMNTIALRISQLALGRQRELTLIANLLR